MFSSLFFGLFLVYTRAQMISECFGDDEILLFDNFLTFDQAVNQCLEANATLASLPNSEINDFAVDFLLSSGLNSRAYIGLKRPFESELQPGTDLLDPKLFTFVDGTEFSPDPTFGQVANILPWGNDRPNNLENDQACGNINADGFWDDIGCDGFQLSLCKRPCSVPSADEEERDQNDENSLSEALPIVLGLMSLILVGTVIVYVLAERRSRKIKSKLAVLDEIYLQINES